MNDFAFVTAPLAGKMLARMKSPTFTGSLEQEQKKAGNKKSSETRTSMTK
jgi:hypothetical protein